VGIKGLPDIYSTLFKQVPTTKTHLLYYHIHIYDEMSVMPKGRNVSLLKQCLKKEGRKGQLSHTLLKEPTTKSRL
jgi:hypothetical protein